MRTAHRAGLNTPTMYVTRCSVVPCTLSLKIGLADFKVIYAEFAAVFNGSLGEYTDLPVSFDLNLAVVPIQLKPCQEVFALNP